MATEGDNDLFLAAPGGTLQLNKPATVAPAAATSAPPSTEPPLLSTSWNQIVGGTKARLRSDLEYQADAADRVIDAAKQGYEASKPDLFPTSGPLSRQSMEDAGPIGQFISVPAVEGIRQALGILGGAGRGALQMVKELVAPTDPITSQVGRLDPGPGWNWQDWKTSGAGPLSSDLSVMPDAFGGSPGDLRNITAPVTEAPPGAFYDRTTAVSPKTLANEANSRAVAAAPNSAVTFETGRTGFRNLDQKGVAFDPAFVDSNIDGVAGASPREIARALAEDENSPVALQQQRLQKFKGQPPMTIQQYQGMMDGIKNSAETAGATTPAGKELFAMRGKLQDAFEGARDSDLAVGDAGDIKTFQDANKSYQQAHKMESIEKMIADAGRTDNETTAFRTKVKNFLGSEAKTRGWTDDEINAVTDAADRGLPATALHALGGRFVGPVAGAGTGFMLGATHDPVWAQFGSLLGTGAGAVMGAPFRWGENMLARRRIQNALGVLGQSVPPRPLDLPEPGPAPSRMTGAAWDPASW